MTLTNTGTATADPAPGVRPGVGAAGRSGRAGRATCTATWSREFTPGRVDLPAGELSIGSRQGITSHDYSPTVRVSALAEPDGPAYGVALAWSGSWRMLVDAPPFGARVRVAGGVDDESGVITLEPGEHFTTPSTLGVCAPDGGDGVRARWHDYQRGWLARDTGLAHRPIVYNSWYATTFDVDVDAQSALAAVAAELGVEAFVVDDGWFRGRTSDRAGLGDWQPDPAKFPHGLAPLVDAVLERGMRFGIWVEPEAVNPDSDLYRAHPDWVYRAGDRPLLTRRNQLVLDLGRPEVVAWTIGWLRELLAKHAHHLPEVGHEPARSATAAGPATRTVGSGRSSTPRATTPCCGCCARSSPRSPSRRARAAAAGSTSAVLALTDVVWPSDETGARDRLAIQHGFLSAYGPHVMSSWVTDEPSRIDREPASFEFRFVVAMAGVLGIGCDLRAWDPAHAGPGGRAGRPLPGDPRDGPPRPRRAARAAAGPALRRRVREAERRPCSWSTAAARGSPAHRSGRARSTRPVATAGRVRRRPAGRGVGARRRGAVRPGAGCGRAGLHPVS